MPSDPYRALEISESATDEEVRAAYRREVQRHHPDHNGGSPESTRRFEEVQEAYASIRRLREGAGTRAETPRKPDPAVAERLAELERELNDARRAREGAHRRAREAADAARSAEDRRRASDGELGYVKTDDSFSKILDDAAEELAGRLAGARQHPAARRIEDMIDEFLKR